jgi:hypothetical protein
MVQEVYNSFSLLPPLHFFFPTTTHNLQKGNAAAHVLQAIYNSIYFGQMVYPDLICFNHTIQTEYIMQLPGPLIAAPFI